MLLLSVNPFDNIGLSALVAAVPIILFLLCLTIFKMKGIYAALTTLVVTLLVALPVFKLPIPVSAGAITEGVVAGIFPIGYIVLMAVWLYKVSIKTGQFNIIQDSIASISQDQRMQLLLIGFCFNAFLEGAAGFGVPIAICAVLLIQLGFEPLKAAMLCLIANGAAGAFGAIGLPVSIIDTFNLGGGVNALSVSTFSALTLPILNFIIPFVLVYIIDGFKGIKEILPIILTVSTTYAGLQLLLTVFQGPELADIIPPLATMVVLAVVCRKYKPKHIFRLQDNQKEIQKRTIKEIIYAWSPFVILTVIVLFWSAPFFKKLFMPGGALEKLVLTIPLPQTVSALSPKGIVLRLDIIGATGTAILLTVILTMIITKINLKAAGALFVEAFKELWIPIITISVILAIAKVMTYGGMTVAMGQGIAKAGSIFPLFSPVLGWIGVFMTGSVTNNNTLFAPIQTTVAQQISTSAPLLVAANTAGGVAAKLISPQSIAIATAAVKKVGEESALLKMTLKYSIGFAIFICIWTYILTLIF
ncbi:L-lactate permease [Staphylococcus simiae]|uniref:L-lactate permease n=1 Tax=Staphylococcus simiae TaxID=308354 RepID=UPI001A95E0D9|nr:L-lactate permease [Staphylococcus simiae]QSY53980.1 L-lactate permease [Staphylococcus simiae]